MINSNSHCNTIFPQFFKVEIQQYVSKYSL